jgi:hypothetical protein
MSEITTTSQDLAPKTQDTSAALSTPDLSPDFAHTKIKSNFTQSPSTYWALMLPLLSARYFLEALNGVVKPFIKFLRFRKAAETGLSEKAITHSLELSDSAWAWLVGIGMLAVTSFYTSQTYGDMRRQFKDALSWEFDKDPEKVGFLDMLKSKNTLVHDTVKNLISRTAKRLAVHLPFFAFSFASPLKVAEDKIVLHNIFKENPNPIKIGGIRYSQLLGPKESVTFGVGANALYLASDALGRKRTFFEALQLFIDEKINHKDAIGETIIGQDLINLYNRAAHNPLTSPLPRMDSPEWPRVVTLFDHMADLMNQTYGNKPKTGKADFTIPKFIYLLGNGLLKSQALEINMAYVDVANRYGIPEVKKVANAINNGADIGVALAEYPLKSAQRVTEKTVENDAVVGDFTDKINAENRTTARTMPAPAASQVDKIARNKEVDITVSFRG